jgi:hypothetical protein
MFRDVVLRYVEPLGAAFFRQLEKKTYGVLIERRIIKAKGMLMDATVFPQKIKYPNDVGLLNDVREWLVRHIKKLGEGKRYRTNRRKARQEYLNFAKKKTKTKKVVKKAKKQMLQHVRRNLQQMKEVIETLKDKGRKIKKKIVKTLGVAETIFAQQWEMYHRKVNRIKDRWLGKQRYLLAEVPCRVKDGSEIWVRAGIMAMNLKMALAKA